MKKFLLLFILCAALVGMMSASFGEEELPEIFAAPAVIDRVADPEAEGEFSFPEGAKLLEIWFPNVMNADEAILIYDGEVWLIDCGDERMGARGAALMEKLGITKVDKLINTHPHHDHLNGLKATDKAAHIGEMLFCFDEKNIRHAKSVKNYRNAVTYAGKKEIAVSSYEDGSDFCAGSMRVAVRVYEKYTILGENRLSMTVTLATNGSEIFASAITAAGSGGFVKVWAWGEDGYLEHFVEAAKQFEGMRPLNRK